MKSFWALVLFDLRRNWLVLAVGLLVAAFAAALPLMPGVHDADDDVRLAAGIAAGLALALGAAAVLAVSGTASELERGTHAFFWSLPVDAPGIWLGRLAARVLLALGAGLLAALPALGSRALLQQGLSPLSGFSLSPSEPSSWMFAILVLVAVYGIVHFLTVAFHARGKWLLIDAFWITAVLTLGAWSFATLAEAGAWRAWPVLAGSRIGALAVAVLVAGLAQAEFGRSDLARSHRWMSAVLGAFLLVLALGLAAEARRVAQPEPGDLAGIQSVRSLPNGWLFVAGSVDPDPFYFRSFLWHPDSGRAHRFGRLRRGPFRSRDGRTVVWLTAEPSGPSSHRLWKADMAGAALHPQPTGIDFPSLPSRVAVSPDGTLLATVHSRTIEVRNLDSGRRLHELETDGYPDGIAFRADGHVAIIARTNLDRGRRRHALLDWNLGNGSVTSLAETTGTGSSSDHHPDRRRWLAGQALIDGLSGRVLADLSSEVDDPKRTAFRFLFDGTIIGYEPYPEGESALYVFEEAGTLRQRLPVGPAVSIHVGGQPSAGQLLLAVSHDTFESQGRATRGPNGRHWQTYRIDLDRGTRTLVGPVLPAARPGSEPASADARLFVANDGRLVEHSKDGTWRTLTRGRPAREPSVLPAAGS